MFTPFNNLTGIRRNATALAVSYRRSVDLLRFATVKTELLDWGRCEIEKTPDFLCLGVNGDVLRARVMYELFNRCSCNLFLETGTFRGSTSILAARLLRAPVYTSEVVARSHWISRLRCLGIPSIHLYHEDSRVFLRRMAKEHGSARPMFYLDAHWGEDLPLQEELNIIGSAWSSYVVIIDDFEVPGEPGFGYDIYDQALSLANIQVGAQGIQVYYPAYAPEESGPCRRGYVVLVRTPSNVLGELSDFPMNLLRRA